MQNYKLIVNAHTLIKRPMHQVPPMQISEITDSAFCKKRARGAGLGVVLTQSTCSTDSQVRTRPRAAVGGGVGGGGACAATAGRPIGAASADSVAARAATTSAHCGLIPTDVPVGARAGMG